MWPRELGADAATNAPEMQHVHTSVLTGGLAHKSSARRSRNGPRAKRRAGRNH
jgi:hypothetical protein